MKFYHFLPFFAYLWKHLLLATPWKNPSDAHAHKAYTFTCDVVETVTFKTETETCSHQAPVVWKLAQPRTAGPWYIHGSVRDILELHFKSQTLSSGSHVFFYKVRAFRTSL